MANRTAGSFARRARSTLFVLPAVVVLAACGHYPAVGAEGLSAAVAIPRPTAPGSSTTTALGATSSTVDLASSSFTAPAPSALGTESSLSEAAPSAGATTAASPGQVIFGQAEVTTQSQAVSVTPEISFLGTGASTLDVVKGQSVKASPGAWTSTVPVVALAPAGTTSANLLLVAASSQSIQVQNASMSGTTLDAPTLAAPLHTSGNQIVDANGDNVVFHGLNYDNLLSSTAPVTEQTFVQAKAWGANLVRVALSESLWLTNSCTYSSGYEAKLDKAVTWITSLGMVALLNLEFNSPMLCQPGAQQEMADNPGSIEFWSQVASRYGKNPLVAFDLYNEPHNISDQVWLDGGQATDTITYEAAGMQSLYDTVRATGTQNLIFISGNTWANTVPARLVSGSNIVYSVHDYTCPTDPPPDCSSKAPYDPSPILDQWVTTSRTLPVVVGEFGWPNPNDATYIANVIAFAQTHGWGWNALAWNTSSGNPFALVSQAPGTGTWEPTASGMPVLAAMAGLAW